MTNPRLLEWTMDFPSDDVGFLLYNPATRGCLDAPDGTYDGAPVTNNVVLTCYQVEEWPLWTNDSVIYLAPDAATFGQVASITGTPHDGSLVQMWRYGANSDQTVAWLINPS